VRTWTSVNLDTHYLGTFLHSPAPPADSPQCAKQPWTAASNHKAYDAGVHDFVVPFFLLD